MRLPIFKRLSNQSRVARLSMAKSSRRKVFWLVIPHTKSSFSFFAELSCSSVGPHWDRSFPIDICQGIFRIFVLNDRISGNTIVCFCTCEGSEHFYFRKIQASAMNDGEN